MYHSSRRRPLQTPSWQHVQAQPSACPHPAGPAWTGVCLTMLTPRRRWGSRPPAPSQLRPAAWSLPGTLKAPQRLRPFKSSHMAQQLIGALTWPVLEGCIYVYSTARRFGNSPLQRTERRQLCDLVCAVRCIALVIDWLMLIYSFIWHLCKYTSTEICVNFLSRVTVLNKKNVFGHLYACIISRRSHNIWSEVRTQITRIQHIRQGARIASFIKPVRRHVWRWTSERERYKPVFGVALMSGLSGFRDNETGDARANVYCAVTPPPNFVGKSRNYWVSSHTSNFSTIGQSDPEIWSYGDGGCTCARADMPHPTHDLWKTRT